MTTTADARGRAAQRAYAARAAAAPAVPLGVWVIAGTPVSEPYPCPCGEDLHHRREPSRHCPCWGRLDVDRVPEGCCAARVARYGWRV